MDLWLALLRGTVLGFVAGMPVGPVNAAVIDTALRKCVVRALAIGVGGALVDFLYSQLAMAGLGPLLAARPGLSSVLLGIGGVVLVFFGISSARQVRVESERAGRRAPVLSRAVLAAFVTGILMTVTNPAALISWVLIAGTVLADMTGWERLLAGIGVFAGTTAWFILISLLAGKGRVRLGARAAWIGRTVGAMLVVYGVFLIGKASVVVWAYAR